MTDPAKPDTARERLQAAWSKHDSESSAMVCRGWVLDGAGPARFGWYLQHPCKQEYLGRTEADAMPKPTVWREAKP